VCGKGWFDTLIVLILGGIDHSLCTQNQKWFLVQYLQHQSEMNENSSSKLLKKWEQKRNSRTFSCGFCFLDTKSVCGYYINMNKYGSNCRSLNYNDWKELFK
jgi:hypothetical protein